MNFQSRRRHSDGWRHARLTVLLTPVAAALMAGMAQLIGGDPIAAAVCGAAGCLLGIIISPDLDQTSITYSEWAMLRVPVIGWLLGTAWVALWFPYSLLLRHRSPLSHGPVIGTLGRAVWLGAVVVLLLSVLRIAPAILLRWETAWVVGGLMVSDAGHWLMDALRA